MLHALSSDGNRDQSRQRASRSRAEPKAKTTSSQAVPKGVHRHLTGEDSDCRRAEDWFLGFFESDHEENGSDPDEPHPNVIAESFVRNFNSEEYFAAAGVPLELAMEVGTSPV